MRRVSGKVGLSGTALGLALVLVLTGLVGLEGLQASNQGIATIYADRVLVLKQLKVVSDSLGRDIPRAAELGISGALEPAEASRRVGAALERARTTWASYLGTYLVTEENEVIAELRPDLVNAELIADGLQDALAQGKLPRAREAQEDLARAFEPVGTQISRLVDVQLEVTRMEFVRSGERLRTAGVLAFSSIALGLALAVAAELGRVRLQARARAAEIAARASDAERRQAQMLRKLFEAAFEGILFSDRKGRITYANESSERLFGYQPGELMGVSIEAVVPGAAYSERKRQVATLPSGLAAAPQEREQNLLRRDGTLFCAEVGWSLMRGQKDPVAVTFISDVTARKESEARVAAYEENLRQMAFDTVLAEERQRRRLAADLHDHVGQGLALALLRLTNLKESIPPERANDLKAGLEFISQALTDIRELTFELSPPVLYDLGLPAALGWLGEKLQDQHQLQVSVEFDQPFPRINDETAGILFRATRELLTNVVKHAKTSQASVSLHHDDSSLTVTVEDPGAGFDASRLKSDEATASFGLFSVREQMKRLGGSLEITSTPGAPTKISMRIPLGSPKDPPAENA